MATTSKRKLPPLRFKTADKESVFAADSIKYVEFRRSSPLPAALRRTGRPGKISWHVMINGVAVYWSFSEGQARKQYLRALKYLEN